MVRFRFFLAEAWEYMVRGRGVSVSSILALTAVLFLLALVLLVTYNVQSLAERLQSRKGLTVFLADGVTEERAQELQALFQGFGEVAEVRFVHREEALQEIEKDLGGFPVATTLGENPLPHSLVVSLIPDVAAREGGVQELAAEFRGYEDVDDVLYGGEWVESLDRSLRSVYTANLAVGGLAAAAVFVVLLTTLRLVFLSRRETIRVLKMVGTEESNIRSPFLILGALQSGIAAAAALAFLAAARGVFDHMLPGVRFLPAGWQAVFLLGTVLVGTVAAWASIEPALRGLERRRDDVVR